MPDVGNVLKRKERRFCSFEQSSDVYFDGRTGLIRLFSGAFDCIDDNSEFVDNDAPPVDDLPFSQYFSMNSLKALSLKFFVSNKEINLIFS